MKTNEPSFSNYLVKDGQAVPEIRKANSGSFNDKLNNEAFETWKQSHTYQTNAPDGSWPVERFDIVWQYTPKQDNADEEWEGKKGYWFTETEDNIEMYSGFKDYENQLSWGFYTRQFAKFKEEVEKPKESETLTIGNISFKKLGNGYIWLTATEGVTIELQPDEIEQLAKFIK